ncbi:MAG: hypothetical protein DWH73_00915 [Planctomycetota bacterium]|nr:MAG: hypothetical protein DWH73_00915 [Planctomycetota bacterium]
MASWDSVLEDLEFRCGYRLMSHDPPSSADPAYIMFKYLCIDQPKTKKLIGGASPQTTDTPMKISRNLI